MSSATEGKIATGDPRAWVALAPEHAMERAADHPYSRGFVPAMGRLLASHPRIGPAFLALYQEIMFSEEGELSREEREMVAAAQSGKLLGES
jgi:hypothetical protein